MERHTSSEIFLTSDYFEDSHFDAIPMINIDLANYGFQDCRFTNCSFRELALYNTSFNNCCFDNCQWILVKLQNTRLSDVQFIESKIMGVNFSECNKFSFSPDFHRTIIDNCVFYGVNMKQRILKECKIVNTDFIESDFREVDFSLTDFKDTMIQKCNFEKADFTTAKGYSIDPFNNKIKKALFSFPEVHSFLPYLQIVIKD